MTEKENDKWQLAFWIMGSLCGVWLVALTSGVINNYTRVEDKFAVSACEIQKVNDKTENYRNERNEQFKEILQRLSRIETKLEK